jgi:protocatechuate 3,4-dioxygenase beta subunit
LLYDMTAALTSADTDPLAHRLTRRGALTALAGFGALALAACGSDKTATASTTAAADTNATTEPVVTTDDTTGTTGTTTAPAATTTAACLVPPEETGGPFPADGSNDNGEGEEANVLDDAEVVRSNITASLDGSGVQPGVPMTLNISVMDASTGCVPMPGAAVYVWHANRDGEYSVYNVGMNPGHSGDSYLRGVQIADTNGQLSFTTILPGRYSGRASHIHFAVFSDGTFANRLLTSQMAFDDDQADALYAAAEGYSRSVGGNHNDQDNIFSDGVDEQMLTLTGDASTGVIGTIVVGI